MQPDNQPKKDLTVYEATDRAPRSDQPQEVVKEVETRAGGTSAVGSDAGEEGRVSQQPTRKTLSLDDILNL